MQRFLAFHFGLVQDVAVLRPLVRLAQGLNSHSLHLLVAPSFMQHDIDEFWQGEIERLAAESGAQQLFYESPFDCLRHLGAGSGMIIAGSESDARAHQAAHQLFQSVPGRFRTVTLQHGLECVGFLHNRRHDATAGRDVRFAADIVVAWFPVSKLASVTPAERGKIYVAGPTSLIDPSERRPAARASKPGLICENLHSVRFVKGEMRESFLETLEAFASRLDQIGERLTLRPHPAGRFTDRKQISLPPNVDVSREPLYDLKLDQWSYCISAPSTILFDFALAGIPAATWVDPDGEIDARHFDGLSEVSTVEDWWRFHMAVRFAPERIVADQERFVSQYDLPHDVADRYRALLQTA